MMKSATVVGAAMALLTLAGTGVVPAVASDFGSYWHDGKAELSGYRLKVSRYGQEREGYAVMIFVTEPFSDSKRVKVNDHTKNPSDVVDVIKLNLVRDFQTGIYDYNTMTSVFSRTSDFAPLKVTFSSAEWCGHVYSEMLYREKITGVFSSYFENESGSVEIDRRSNGVSEDNLFILLRGLRGDFLAAGESKTVELLPGAYYSRLAHRRISYRKATVSRSAEFETIDVPAGSFETMRYNVAIPARAYDRHPETGGRTGTFWIESAYPHKIVRWSLAPDVMGELTGSERLEYWRLHDNGDESYLPRIGLADLDPR